jgi:alkanesulfonate monooxygenase SsuD/methylene tetrahydromethanopterin reductase-like flavin-dependent oxidoreductase (luciferase family)
LPNPVQLTGWLLEAMPVGWCAPCPMLLPVRPVALVAEEVAWLAARFPGRVAVGVAPGALALDFEVMDLSLDEAVPRFTADLPRLVAMLRGEGLGRLEGDVALAACRQDPITVVSTAMSTTAVRRAAAVGAGVLYDGASATDRLRVLSDRYHDAGGRKSRVLIRRVWLGAPPTEAFDRQVEVYRSYSTASAQQQWRDNGWLCREDPGELAGDLARALAGSGSDVLNLRVHAPGLSRSAVRNQIQVLGTEVVPLLRSAIGVNDG